MPSVRNKSSERKKEAANPPCILISSSLAWATNPVWDAGLGDEGDGGSMQWLSCLLMTRASGKKWLGEDFRKTGSVSPKGNESLRAASGVSAILKARETIFPYSCRSAQPLNFLKSGSESFYNGHEGAAKGSLAAELKQCQYVETM